MCIERSKRCKSPGQPSPQPQLLHRLYLASRYRGTMIYRDEDDDMRDFSSSIRTHSPAVRRTSRERGLDNTNFPYLVHICSHAVPASRKALARLWAVFPVPLPAVVVLICSPQCKPSSPFPHQSPYPNTFQTRSLRSLNLITRSLTRRWCNY